MLVYLYFKERKTYLKRSLANRWIPLAIVLESTKQKPVKMEEKKELTYLGLKEMKKNDFARLFKKAAPWKKATAVLFLAKYKFSNGKVNLVAIPYKKYNEAAKCYKNEVKKDSIYSAKLTCLAALEQSKDNKGNMLFKITPTQGAMNIDFLQTYATELFGKLKVGIEVIGNEGKMDEEDLLEVVEAADETLSSKKAEKLVAKQAKRVAKAQKIQEKLSSFEKAIGKVDMPKLEENLEILQQIYEQIKAEAMIDGEIDKQEQEGLQRLEKHLQEKILTVEVVKNIKEYTPQILAAVKVFSKS